MRNNSSIPPEFNKFFWDVDINKLDVWNNRCFIITRILNFGDLEAVRWLFKTYGEETIKETVKISRSLLPKPAGFWQAYFDLKEEEIRCFKVYKEIEGLFNF
jgi:hypothetical protein